MATTPNRIRTLEAKLHEETSDTDETKVYDLYAPLLNFKDTISSIDRIAVTVNWIPSGHKRRIKAYELLHSYWNNYSRDFRKSPESGDTSQNDNIVEDGTPAWFCGKITNKLLGDNVSINIPIPKLLSSEETLDEMLNEKGLEPEIKTDIEERKKTLVKAKKIIAERERYLQSWFIDYMVYNMINKNERKCSYLGDCVYFVEWDIANKVPKIKTYDPGFVFPYEYDNLVGSLDPASKDGVSKRYILAWENLSSSTDAVFEIYREIYELRTMPDNESRCFRQRARFAYNGETGVEIFDLDENALIEGESLQWEDLQIDFMPFIWVPNFEIEGELFGISNIHLSIGLFDNMINTYTDLSINSEYLGGAVVGISGKNIRFRKDAANDYEPLAIEIQPRCAYNLGEDGKMTLIDTSNMQKALLETYDKQEEILLRNNDIPDVVAGRLKRANIPSGYALAIMMQPLFDRINPMRQQRQQRYSMLFEAIQKLWAAFGSPYERKLFANPLYDVIIQFGRMIPQDTKTDFENFNSANNLLDVETVLSWVKDAGYDIDIDLVMQRKEEQAQRSIEQKQALFDRNRDIDTGEDED